MPNKYTIMLLVSSLNPESHCSFSGSDEVLRSGSDGRFCLSTSRL